MNSPRWLVGGALLLCLTSGAAPAVPTAPRPSRDSSRQVINLLVVNFDPVLHEHGNVRLSQYSKWNDPRLLTTNLVRDLREASGGFAEYRIVDWIDVDAFPQKRDGFRYTEASFLEMWKDRKKVMY